MLDFGVAKATDALASSGVDPTRTGALLGTPYYMSPEQAQGLKSVDFKTDIWALGVVAFECLTGTRPFSAPALGPLVAKIIAGPIPTPSTIAPDAQIPPEIDAWMTRTMARNPADRFSNAKEAAEAFFIAAGVADSMQRDRTSGRDVSRAAGGVSIGVDDSGSHVITPTGLDPAGLAATMAIPNAIWRRHTRRLHRRASPRERCRSAHFQPGGPCSRMGAAADDRPRAAHGTRRHAGWAAVARAVDRRCRRARGARGRARRDGRLPSLKVIGAACPARLTRLDQCHERQRLRREDQPLAPSRLRCER